MGESELMALFKDGGTMAILAYLVIWGTTRGWPQILTLVTQAVEMLRHIGDELRELREEVTSLGERLAAIEAERGKT